MADSDNESGMMSVEEMRRKLGTGGRPLSRGLAYHAINEGQIPHFRVGRKILVARATVDSILAGRPLDAA